MRVLLARRFRENSNAAHLPEEEEEEEEEEEKEDPRAEQEKTDKEKDEEQSEKESASADQSSSGPVESQQENVQTNPPKQQRQQQQQQQQHHQKLQPPREKRVLAEKDSSEKRLPKKPLSVVSRQPPTPSPQRKRRLVKSAQEKTKNDRKLPRCFQSSASSSKKEETSLLDRKPRARETGIQTTQSSNPKASKVAAVAVKSAIPKEATSSPKAAPLPNQNIGNFNSNKSNSKKMVSGGTGRNHHRRHGNSREREEEHSLNWQYSTNNNHAVVQMQQADSDNVVAHDATEIIVQPTTPTTVFDGPLENDPASARGDVSSSSPERQNHGNNFNSAVSPNRHNASRMRPAASMQSGSNGITNNKKEMRFRDNLKKERGLEIMEQDGDGNCLFRAISLQVYGDPSMHGDVRKQCMDHMERDQGHFSQFVTGEPFLQYVARTRQDGVHGNNPEIQASSELFNRPIEVFTPENGSSPLNIFHAEYKTGDVPIRLSYHDGNHYNAVIDPFVPTAGLGLGLPGLKPGYADKKQMDKAIAESMDAAADHDETELREVLKASQAEYKNSQIDHDDDLQRAIKESQFSAEHMSSNNALSLSDMDATYFELEQAALERSLQSFSQKEEGKKQSASPGTSRTIAGDSSKPDTITGDVKAPAVAPTAATASSATASLPCPSQESIPLAAAAAPSSVASAAARENETTPQRLLPIEEYPSSVRELVMNGFPLSTVVKAFDLVGNNFDHMLSLCLANTNR